MQDNILIQGLILMLVGMSTVFVFLLLLISVMNVSSKFVPKLAFMLPDPEPPAPKRNSAKANDGAATAVAIAAAMRRRGR